jgi:hypothetical protein
MTDREKSSEDSISPGRHGKHGGSEESEGAPQEDAPEAPAPRERDDTDRTKR